MAARIKKNDRVVILSGKDKGKQGNVLEIDVKADRVRVAGVAIAVKHVKARRQGDTAGIRKQEQWIDASKVMPIDPTIGKPVRVRIKEVDGKRVRVSARSGEMF